MFYIYAIAFFQERQRRWIAGLWFIHHRNVDDFAHIVNFIYEYTNLHKPTPLYTWYVITKRSIFATTRLPYNSSPLQNVYSLDFVRILTIATHA